MATEKKKSKVKELTLKQLNDLIEKNKKLKADLAAATKDRADTKDCGEELFRTKNELYDVKMENEKLETKITEMNRRLGSKDYRKDIAENLDEIESIMDENTKDMYQKLLDFRPTDREAIQLALALVQQTSPGAKYAFLKSFTAMESPGMRASVFIALSKLVEGDKMKESFVKEIPDDGSGSTSSVGPEGFHDAVPDPASVDQDVKRYYTDKNEGCRVVKVNGVCLLATTSNEKYITRHKPPKGGDWKEPEAKCLGCGKTFSKGVSEIAPVTVVGPQNHGRLGDQVWVCREHWEISVSVDHDTELDVAVIEHESLEFLPASPLLKPKARRRLSLTKNKDDE